MIHFSVFDYDVITSNDFGGECYVSLSSIPGVQCQKSYVGNLHGLKPVDLNLICREHKEHPLLSALDTRTEDKTAQNFVKKHKERFHEL